jgi:hypothetical protein
VLTSVESDNIFYFESADRWFLACTQNLCPLQC